MLAIAGLSLAAMGFVAMQPIFWTLPDRVHDRIRRGRGHRLDQLPGQPGRVPGAQSCATTSRRPSAATPACTPLAVGAVVGAILFALTALFKKANEIEAGHLDEVDAQIRGPH